MPFFLASARMDHDSHGDLPASLSFSTHQQHIASKAHWPAGSGAAFSTAPRGQSQGGIAGACATLMERNTFSNLPVVPHVLVHVCVRSWIDHTPPAAHLPPGLTNSA